MTDAAWFGIAVVLLVGALIVGLGRWRGSGPGDVTDNPITRFVLVSTAIGGVLGAPFWWLDLTPSFAWDLLPLASRMLAAAALAFGIAGIVVLEHPTPGRTRLYLILTALYLVPLGLAVVLFHLDRFDFNQPVTYGFFAVVVVLSLGSLLALSRRQEPMNDGPEPPAIVRAWLIAGGGVLIVWGAALFAVPTTPYPLVFNWAADPLTSRLIGSMLFTVGSAFCLSLRDVARARLSLILGGVYGVGVAAACSMAASAGKPVPPLYAGGFIVVGLVSLALFAIARSRMPAARAF